MSKILVKFEDKIIGTLFLTKEKKIMFKYSSEWLENGFSLNPFKLPLSDKVFVATTNYFDGLFGVFADSLPDSWGNLLLDRMLRAHGVDRSRITVLDRLSFIGDNGMGALSYEPVKNIELTNNELTLDEINEECKNILMSKECLNLDEMYKLGGSSGGARPKILINYEGKPWIVKFSNTLDSKDSGIIEYEYFHCARECGINVPNTKLFSSNISSGYFGIERFDVSNGKRVHMVSVAGLLEIDYRAPSLDYIELIKLTKILTNDIDTYEMYRRMCFNVFSHNLDDHSKNFSFLYNLDKRCWELSPAYDLTYSNTYFGEHTTSVNGKGIDISIDDLLQVGIKNKLDKDICLSIITEVKERVEKMLGNIIKKLK
jgi:serine/threonine-protein kinase HipA